MSVWILYGELRTAHQSLFIVSFIKIELRINPLSPHDALKHHFTSLETDLIFIQLGF